MPSSSGAASPLAPAGATGPPGAPTRGTAPSSSPANKPGQPCWKSYAVGFVRERWAPTARAGLGQKPSLITSRHSAPFTLRSVHVDKHLNTAVFANEHLKRLVDGAKRLDTDSTVSVRRPITLSILEKIVNPAPPPSASLSPAQLDSLRVDTAFKVAFAGFLRMGEFTYNKAELKDRTTFQKERPLLGEVVIKPSHATFTLKRSKKSQFQGVSIRLARTGSSTCPVAALEALRRHDTRPIDSPLFLLSSGSFSRSELLGILSTRLRAAGLWQEGFTGHSFRKGAAQTALDRGLSKEDIQLLGRWSSDAVELYYKHAEENIVRLSRKLLSTSPLPGSSPNAAMS
jgi:hypothetical protein